MSFLRSAEDQRANGVILPKRNPIDLHRSRLAERIETTAGHGADIPKSVLAAPTAWPHIHPDLPPPSEEEIKKSLKEHLQTAVMIELSTIPVYLYAMYSVRDLTDKVVPLLRSIAIEEMLHLALAGNIYLALSDGPEDTPCLYHSPHFPCYPSQMVSRKPDLELQLRSLDQSFIELGKQVECRIHDTQEEDLVASSGDEYESLGQFYRGCITLIEGLPSSAFENMGENRQILNEDMVYVHHSKDLQSVVDAVSAIHALNTIIEQGEGGKDGDEESHLFKFCHMQSPQGGTWPIPVNPSKQIFESNNGVAEVSELFDAGYCYLLLSIEEIWKSDPGTRRRIGLGHNIRTMMRDVLAPLAWWLVETPILNQEGLNAGPRFGFYDFEQGSGGVLNAFEQLNALTRCLPSRVSVELKDVTDAIGNLYPLKVLVDTNVP